MAERTRDFARRAGSAGDGFAGWMLVLALATSLILMFCIIVYRQNPPPQPILGSDLMQNRNRMQQICLALHVYHEQHGAFPMATAYRTREGEPGLSWRVAILPYLEEEELHREFRLEEPWDSPHNLRLLSRMPRVFERADGKSRDTTGHTPFQVIRGKDCVFDDAYPARRGAPAVGLIGRPFGEIRDQGATTLLLAMAATPLPWTAPEDINADDGEPIEPRFSRRFRSHLNVTADGAVRQVERDWGEERWRAFLRIQGPAPRWE